MALLIPAIFSPRVLRKRTSYADLSTQSLSVSEKSFLGSEAANVTSFLQWDKSTTSVLTQISNRYRLPYSSVKNWSTKIKLNQPIVNQLGRPASMDKIAAEAFVETLTKRRDAKDCVPLAETLTLLGNGVAATKVRQGKRGMDAVSSICVTTQKKLCKQFNVVKRKPQPLTDARLKACLCPRLSYIWGCVLMAYSANLMAENKWNADATTIIVSQKGTGALVCIIGDPEDKSPISSSTIPDTLNLLVKWFALNNAGGESGPLVLIFAIPTMAEDTYFATQVTSMSSTTAIGDRGWVYFSRTRGGCKAMWTHYFLTVTVPTIAHSNSVHLHTVSSFP
jgi:hypothetical protein